MNLYKKKPVIIEARQFKGSPSELHDIYLWIEDAKGSIEFYDKETPEGVTINPEDGSMVIRTLEGDMKVSLFDYVIKGVQGEFYPCKPDIFESTYEKVNSNDANS